MADAKNPTGEQFQEPEDLLFFLQGQIVCLQAMLAQVAFHLTPTDAAYEELLQAVKQARPPAEMLTRPAGREGWIAAQAVCLRHLSQNIKR